MLNQTEWRFHFPGLSGLSEDVAHLLVRRARAVHLAKDSVIFGPGSPEKNLLLLTSGTVRVQQMSETGRKIVLSRAHAGESCVLTPACLLAFEDYSAEGIAETEVEAVLIPRDSFDDLMSMSKEFRAFVFDACSKRIIELFVMIEEIACERMDIRLPRKLPTFKSEGNVMHMIN